MVTFVLFPLLPFPLYHGLVDVIDNRRTACIVAVIQDGGCERRLMGRPIRKGQRRESEIRAQHTICSSRMCTTLPKCALSVTTPNAVPVGQVTQQ